MRRQLWTVASVAALTGMLLAGCASNSTGAGASTVKVAVVYSRTGLLAAYGKNYVDGFAAGLDYATHGTGTAGGHRIDVTYADDAGDPAVATATAKQYIGDGYRILAGTVDSGIAAQLAPLAAQNRVLYISGPAAADRITGINRYVFRSGRQTYQDVATAGTYIGDPAGKRVLVLAQDSTFGQGNAAAVKAILGGKGAHVSQLLVPLTATDFTPFALQAAQAKADLVFVAWAGATTLPMWRALDQQKVLSSTAVVTGLGNAGSFAAYGPAAGRINFLSYYFPQATSNSANAAMISAIEKAGSSADLFSPDGFVAAQMIVHAVEQAGGDNVDGMIKALEGWTFDAPKGPQTIRARDHAMLQPMFQARLVQQGTTWEPELVRTIPPDATAPAAT
jgi:branched-chain amino acid transport system substrate-binding protein